MRFTSLTLLSISCLFLAVDDAPAAFVNNPALLNSNDSVSWSQLGNAGTSVLSSFIAVSSNGTSLLGTLSQSTGGTVAQVCPATHCNYASAPGFSSGDFLLWTEDASGNGTGPLTLMFATPVQGVGFYLQLTAPGSFTANFTKIAGANTSTEYSTSDSQGNPLFVGALDATADITGLIVGPLVCTPSSPGGCNAFDFAVDHLYLTTSVPEPTTFLPVFLALILFWFCCRCRSSLPTRGLKRIFVSGLLGGFLLTVTTEPMRAQDPIPITPGEMPRLDSSRAARKFSKAPSAWEAAPSASAAVSTLPIWRYQIASPVNGFSYGGYMVGTSPFNRGARTTTIPVILVPLIVKFTNTATGFNATFDPSAAPDAGCTTGQTAMSLVENSPIFGNYDWTFNGIYVGSTQYIDAFQRANFWQYVQNTGDAYHTLLSYTVGDPLTLAVNYPAPTLGGEVRTGVQGSCTNPGGSGSINGAGYQGIVDMNTLHTAMTSYIAAHGITPEQLPVFILYNVMYSENNQTVYFGGYHFSEAPYPQVLTSPGQTFVLANFRTNGTGPLDVAILSHEIAEWMNDPGGYNAAPSWGHIGEVSGCQPWLEVADPLTLTDLPTIAGPDGFTYHLQELAFFSWFFRTPSIGAGAVFSNNGTFTVDAGAACQ